MENQKKPSTNDRRIRSKEYQSKLMIPGHRRFTLYIDEAKRHFFWLIDNNEKPVIELMARGDAISNACRVSEALERNNYVRVLNVETFTEGIKGKTKMINKAAIKITVELLKSAEENIKKFNEYDRRRWAEDAHEEEEEEEHKE